MCTAQFNAAGLCPFDNSWWNVHDFHAAEGPHFELLQPEVGWSTVLGRAPDEAGEPVTPGFVVPRTWGSRPLPFEGRVRRNAL